MCHLSNVIDDLDIAPDFFSYFSATKWLLDNDPSIWCVSAWNDNGKEGYVSGSGECVHESGLSQLVGMCFWCHERSDLRTQIIEWLY